MAHDGGEKKDQRQHANRILRLREKKEDCGQRDNAAAEDETVCARHEYANEDQKHHCRARLVFVREHSAPASGMFGFEEVGRLVNRKLWCERNPQVACREHDEGYRRHQIAEVTKVLR
jgi:hypothetical protein